MKIILSIAQLPRATFYGHLKGMKRAGKCEQEKAEIAAVSHENKGRYGYRHITMVLRGRNICLNLRLSGGLMKELDLICRVRMKKYRSHKGEVGKTAPNLLDRDIFAERSNRKRAANVTEFSLFGQEQYLSPILDLHSGYLVSYTISERSVLSMATLMLDKNRRIKAKPKGLPPAIHRQQAL